MNDQAALAAQVRANASGGRIDTPEALGHARGAFLDQVDSDGGETPTEDQQQALMGAVEVDPSRMDRARPPTMTAPVALSGGSPEGTLPGMGGGGDAVDMNQVMERIQVPRHDGFSAPTSPVSQPVTEDVNEVQVRNKKWRASINVNPDGGWTIGAANRKGEGGKITIGGAGKPGYTDIPGTGIGVKDGSVVKGGFSIGGLFSKPQKGAAHSGDSVYNVRPSTSRVDPNPYEAVIPGPGAKVNINGTNGIVVEVSGNQALVAVDDPIDGSRMVYVGLESFEVSEMSENTMDGVSVENGQLVVPSDRIKGFTPGTRVREDEREGTVMEFGETASFISFDDGALSWIDNRKLLSEDAASLACGNCQTPILESFKFCGSCGSQFEE